MNATKQTTSDRPATPGKVKPVVETPTFTKDSEMPLSYSEKPPLLDAKLPQQMEELDDTQFENLQEQLAHEAFVRSPEHRGDMMFQELMHEKDLLTRKQVHNAKDAVRLISGAITTFADHKDPRAKIRQDDGPVINHARERVEMTTTVRSLRFVRGRYTVWVSIAEDEDDARCGVVIKRRWRDPIHITADEFPTVLEKLAWHFSLAGRI